MQGIIGRVPTTCEISRQDGLYMQNGLLFASKSKEIGSKGGES